ncbi:MAG: AI-2E family transporter [Frankiaceae bacterium]|nr:AI-2E family transporter [Frankiaceae bacterium]
MRPGPSPVPDDHPEDDALEERIDREVREELDERSDEFEDLAGQAESSAADARRAAGDAQVSRESAVAAGRTAVEAVEAVAVVAADDPLLDTAVRKIEAQADEENPFGRPGRPLSRRSPFRVGFTAALGVALAYALVQALVAVRSVLILLLISAFLAIGLNPAVEALERRGLGRSRAVGAVLVGVLLFFVGFGFAVVPPIIDQVGQLADKAPDYIRELQGNRRVAALDDRLHFLEKAKDYLSHPENAGTAVFGGVLGVGKVVFSAFFSTLTVLILTLYFLSNLPSIKASAYRAIPRSRRARVGLLADEILERVGSYVGGALVIAACAGVTTFVILLIFGVPYPVALALLVAITDLIPLVGATIGAIVVTVVSFFVSARTGIIVGVYYAAYQQFENYVLYPRVMKRSVDVSPAATVVAVLIGGSLLGVLGALLAIPIAAAVQLVLQEVVIPRQDDA